MQQPMAPMPNDPSHRPRRKLTRAEIRRRRRRRAARRLTVFFCALALVAGGVSFAVTRMQAAASSASTTTPASSTLPAGSAASGSNSPAASSSSQAASSVPAVPQNALGLTAAEAQAMLNDSRMVLVNHDSPMPEDYTFDTKECGSATAINKTLQTEAADAFLEMQAAAAADGVTIWMQSGYRSVSYQTTLYNNKTQQYLNQGYDEATARELAAGIVNPPGYSEHNCGLAADLNCPDFTDLDTGFENTTAFA